MPSYQDWFWYSEGICFEGLVNLNSVAISKHHIQYNLRDPLKISHSAVFKIF